MLILVIVVNDDGSYDKDDAYAASIHVDSIAPIRCWPPFSRFTFLPVRKTRTPFLRLQYN